MSSTSGYIAIPHCPVIFDGTNYTEFASFMRIHMRGLRLWGVLSGEVSCPPYPVSPVTPISPTPSVLAADASQVDKDATKSSDDVAVAIYDKKVLEYTNALSTFRDDLTSYTQWMDDDAHAAAILTSSVLPQFASEFMGLGTISEMWIHLRQRYQPSGDALYLSVVRQEHALQQGDSTVDEFYAQSSAIWRQLDSLRTAGCGAFPCCQAMRADLEFHRVYKFLSRLRREFEPRRAQLFARGRVSLLEALFEIRAEETRLRGAGLLEVPSVLAARAPAASLLPTSSGGEGHPRVRLHCGYCDRDGHPKSDCFRKQCHMRNMEHGSSSVTPSAVAFTEQDILKLKHLLAS
jgi:hypothetical protein